MLDVLKFVHRIGAELVPRTSRFSNFVKMYYMECGSEECGWGIKLLKGELKGFEINCLTNHGFEVPRPDIIIGRGDPSELLLDMILPKRPVFYLTKHDRAKASFALLVRTDRAVLEAVRSPDLYLVRRTSPEIWIDSHVGVRGNPHPPLIELWAKAWMNRHDASGLNVVIEGWLYNDGSIGVYDVEISRDGSNCKD